MGAVLARVKIRTEGAGFFLRYLCQSSIKEITFVHTAAHNPERATPTLGLRHGVFTDQFIFRHILGEFFSRKWNIHHAMNAFEV